ncbi:ATP-binding protein [Vibrio parahaemolyticus]|nr:AAA family ATPase [Vibrio parahaemolyticus]TBT33343.1 ATP-binding protein [Vibrio parahaemolyticus]
MFSFFFGARMGRYINQRLLSINVDKLKGIENLRNLTFTPHNVTAILGANCIGKSSLLHALASCYQPEEGERSENHRMSEYLKPNPHALWNSTKFDIRYEYIDRATPQETVTQTKVYEKTNDRWKPIYARRPYRCVFYVGIHTTLPILEYINFIKNKSSIGSQRIRYETSELTDDMHRLVKEKAGYVLNKNYTHIYKHRILGWSEDLYGLACDDMTYSQISMGAGEQRVIKILKTVFDAPESSIILIDEIDLLLHEDAFQRIIEVIKLRAKNKKLQIIFTTHRESVLKKSNIINVRYLYKSNEETLVLEQVTPDALQKLTGVLDKSITLYVEDKLSSRVIKKVCQSLRISRHIKTIEFGAAENCFAITAGAIISNPDASIFSVLDGDVFVTPESKQDKINTVITGNSRESNEHRQSTLERIYQYQIPPGISPEQHIKQSIVALNRNDISDEFVEIYDALSNINAVLNRHNYINEILDFYDETPDIIVKDVVSLFATTPQWNEFVNSIKQALEAESQLLQLN